MLWNPTFSLYPMENILRRIESKLGIFEQSGGNFIFSHISSYSNLNSEGKMIFRDMIKKTLIRSKNS